MTLAHNPAASVKPGPLGPAPSHTLSFTGGAPLYIGQSLQATWSITGILKTPAGSVAWPRV
jgi:hypothetical protein